MHTLFSDLVLLSALVMALAAIVTLRAFQHAPEGRETEEGFQFAKGAVVRVSERDWSSAMNASQNGCDRDWRTCSKHAA